MCKQQLCTASIFQALLVVRFVYNLPTAFFGLGFRRNRASLNKKQATGTWALLCAHWSQHRVFGVGPKEGSSEAFKRDLRALWHPHLWQCLPLPAYHLLDICDDTPFPCVSTCFTSIASPRYLYNNVSICFFRWLSHLHRSFQWSWIFNQERLVSQNNLAVCGFSFFLMCPEEATGMPNFAREFQHQPQIHGTWQNLTWICRSNTWTWTVWMPRLMRSLLLLLLSSAQVAPDNSGSASLASTVHKQGAKSSLRITNKFPRNPKDV